MKTMTMTTCQLIKGMKNTSKNWTGKSNDTTRSLPRKEKNIWRSSADSELKLLEWQWNTSGIILLGIENPDQLDEKGGNIYEKQGNMHENGQRDTFPCRTDQDEKQGSKWFNTKLSSVGSNKTTILAFSGLFFAWAFCHAWHPFWVSSWPFGLGCHSSWLPLWAFELGLLLYNQSPGGTPSCLLLA